MSKIMSATDAIALIPDGCTLGVTGTGPALEPDLLLATLEQRFLTEGRPGALSLFLPMLPGDRKGEGGLNSFAHKGMMRQVMGASFSRARHPAFLDIMETGEVEGYITGMGTMIQILTATGSGKPGVVTKVGLGTFIDPRHGGGAMNAASVSPPVRLIEIEGEEMLFYPAQKIDVALIRGTTADENGYVSFEEETNTLGAVEMALACKASGGTVIVQVKRVARAGSLDPRTVRIPGPLIDAIVVHPAQTQLSPMMADPAHGWNPFLAGALKRPLDDIRPLPLSAEKALLRRAALELREGDVINLGAGVATRLPIVALEEGILDRVTFTNEHGIFGGLMATAVGGSFVPAFNADAIMDSVFQFNFYDGGGLDVTFLGIGQVDGSGNLNVSRFGAEVNGPGGFINITSKTRRIVFCGTLTSGGLRSRIDEGRLRIEQEGRFGKFVPRVEEVTFNAAEARARGQEVLYITDRAVFRLGETGPELIEIAPGIDLDRDIRSRVGFELAVSPRLSVMAEALFREPLLGLASSLPKGDRA
ncbi:acyl CoA:acetate/3-ketoacid CoA transferase [Cereibacter azotoformans]|uniref:Acetate CoA-transferase YdiF n=1 Tax=Cereibacter azotoformans TaxID=43057 RepID=A0A2T5KD67_9RHOB|nr:CoA-transferase [Cereibacter azotoformans]MBO4168650.1 acyl CoA:acetate/3-ketoacid CoA transferase [Cereibacter azotoformans]PTR20360.1 propionate CoA-transferase/acetate CoA-transferase [Cereibacter azotoformans]UIJ31920.1 acyl CoA:acetate/3-ketoacid CoA transferase [Cereibacter azotoformans]